MNSQRFWITFSVCRVDLGSNNSGYYDLQAVLTHQGRSSSSGHYVAWVKRKEAAAVYTVREVRDERAALVPLASFRVNPGSRPLLWSYVLERLVFLQAAMMPSCRPPVPVRLSSFFSLSADEWVKFDDDKVSVVTPEDILKLSGGGDWHIAYVLLYGPRRLELVGSEEKQQ
ncbi:hypothetical protein NFI96_002175 [Prochilodus magdalenae]|nr:hypothetical protein NFI96_002175 [Prochilodus magdalenae]